MLTTCLVCHVRIPKGSRCKEHRLSKSPQSRIRSSRQWTEQSKTVRSLGFCAQCRKPFPPSELQADHVIPLSKDLGSSVIQPICRDCHRVKTYHSDQ